MNWNALWGVVLLAYAVLVVVLAITKPEAVWKMKKIRTFEKVLGEKGTVIFFYVFAAIAAGFGVWFLIATPVG